MAKGCKKKFLKRLGSAVLVLCMSVASMPVFTQQAAVTVDKKEENSSMIGGLELGTPRYADGWIWDGIDTLKLFGADLTAKEGEQIIASVPDIDTLHIDVQNYNKITLTGDGSFAGVKNNLEVSGSGILSVALEDESTLLETQNGTITYNVGYLKAEGSGVLASDGADGNGALEILGGYIEAPDVSTQMSKVDVLGGYVHIDRAGNGSAKTAAYVNGGYLWSESVNGSVSYESSVVKVGGADGINLEEVVFNLKKDDSVLMLVSAQAASADAVTWTAGSQEAATRIESQTGKKQPVLVYCHEQVADGVSINGSHEGIYGYSENDEFSFNQSTISGGNYFELAGSSAQVYVTESIVTAGAVLAGVNEQENVEKDALSLYGYVDESKMQVMEGATLIGYAPESNAGGLACENSVINGNGIGVGGRGIDFKNVSRQTSAGYFVGVNKKSARSYNYSGIRIQSGYDDIWRSRLTAYGYENAPGISSYYAAGTVEREVSAYSESGSGLRDERELKLSVAENGQLSVATGAESVGTGKTDNNQAVYMETVSVDTAQRVCYAADGPGKNFRIEEGVGVGRAMYYIGDGLIREFTYAGYKSGDETDGSPKLCYRAGSTITLKYAGSFALENEDQMKVHIKNEQGNTADSLFDITKSINGTKVSVQLRLKEDATPQTQYTIEVTCGDFTVKEQTMKIVGIQYELDFRNEYANGWEYGGFYKGMNENSSGAGWTWYGKDTQVEGVTYEACTLVLDNFHLDSYSPYGAIFLPSSTTVILKGENYINCRWRGITSDDDLKITSYMHGEGSLTIESLEDVSVRHDSNNLITTWSLLELDHITLRLIGGAPAVNPSVAGSEDATGIWTMSLSIADSNITADINRDCGSSAIVAYKTYLKGTNHLSLQAAAYGLKTSYLYSSNVTELSNVDSYESAAALNEAVDACRDDEDKIYYIDWSMEPVNVNVPVVIKTQGITQTKAVQTQGTLKPGTQIDINLNRYFEGGSGRYAFELDGELPEGITFDAVRGVISGTVLDKNIEKTECQMYVTETDANISDGTKLPFTFTFGPAKRVHTLTVTGGENGTVSPAGVTEVFDGEDAQVEVTPDNGYRVKSVRADGNLTKLTDGMYTFENVVGDHTLEVEFEKIPEYQVTVTNPGESHLIRYEEAVNGAEKQTVLDGNTMQDIMYTVEDGYYLPDDYVNQIAGMQDGSLNGIRVTRVSDTNLRISGTPVSDAAIVLPAASKKMHVELAVQTEQGLVYNGQPQKGYTGITVVSGGYEGDYEVTYYESEAEDAKPLTQMPKDAGTYLMKVSVPESNTRYEGSTSVSFTIDTKELTVTAKDAKMTAGDTVPEFEYEVTGLAEGDSLEAVFDKNSCKVTVASGVDTSVEGVYQAGLIVEGAVLKDSGVNNYKLVCNAGTLTVEKKNLPPVESGSPVQSDNPIQSGSPVQSDNPIQSGSPIQSDAPEQSGNPTASPLPEGTPGDVNEDGYINLVDAQLTLKAALKIQPLEEDKKLLADVNRDGTVNLLDAQLILKRALKIINEF